MLRSQYNLVMVIVCIGHCVSRDGGEGVRLGVSGPRLMCEAKVKAAEVQGPLCLLMREVLCCTPVLEVAVVRDDVERLRETFEVMSPIFEGMDDGKHFLIVDLIVLLCFDHRLGPECYRMP